jgi:diguanylate cyclase (GGDEF)-like protein
MTHSTQNQVVTFPVNLTRRGILSENQTTSSIIAVDGKEKICTTSSSRPGEPLLFHPFEISPQTTKKRAVKTLVLNHYPGILVSTWICFVIRNYALMGSEMRLVQPHKADTKRRGQVLRGFSIPIISPSALLIIATLIPGLYLLSNINYLLFHNLAELFSILIAWSITIFAWNSRRYIENEYFLFLGIAYLFIGSLDLIHTLAYKGMGVFPNEGANLPTQLWIASRYLESVTYLAAPIFLRRRLNIAATLGVFSLITATLVIVIIGGYFPVSYIEGSGLTTFKVTSEYIIAAILIVAIFHLIRRRSEFNREVLEIIIIALGLTATAELVFTTYINVNSFPNFVGHVLKIVAYIFIYEAIIRTGFLRPNSILFRGLQKARQAEEDARQRAEARANELEALRANLTDILSEQDLAKLLEAILVRACGLLKATGGDLALFIEERQQLKIVVSHKMKSDYSGTLMEKHEGAMGFAIQTGEPVIIPHYPSWIGRSQQFHADNWNCVMAAPLQASEQIVGAIAVGKNPDEEAFSDSDVHLFTLFAHQAALAIRNTQLFEQAQHRAQIDSLTELYSRRHFFELGEEEIYRARRYRHPLSAIMLDIDHFKTVNDTYGHAVGDQVLVALAMIMRSELREVDIIGRIGGEEFVILLPETRLEGAKKVAERIRLSIKNSLGNQMKNVAINLTVSMGVSELDEESRQLDPLLAQADRALYDAKQTGRDRVVSIS